MTEIAGLKKNVNFLNWAAAAIVVGLFAMSAYFLDRIDSRFDRADEPVRAMQIQMERMSVQLDRLERDVSAIKSDVGKSPAQ